MLNHLLLTAASPKKSQCPVLELKIQNYFFLSFKDFFFKTCSGFSKMKFGDWVSYNY